MQCPACQTVLTMSERQGIEIDYCPSCRGVWLDRGELDKIVERSVGATAQMAERPAAAIPHGYDDHRYGHRGHKRRKSFLEELFD
jgi:hypothetical protein